MSKLALRGMLALFAASSPFAQPCAAQEASPLDVLLSTKISSATKYDQKMMRIPASVTILTSEDLDRYGYRTLGEALDSLAGVYTSYDRNYEYVGIRGFGRPTDYNNRVLILIDGHPINENIYEGGSVGTELVIDLSAVERIEFVRGPGSAVYGTSAMFGVVNIVLKNPEENAGTAATASVGSQRFAGWATHSAWKTARGARIMISAIGDSRRGDNLYYPEFDSAETNFGWANGRDGEHRYGLTGTIAFGELKILGHAGSRTKQIPTGSYDTPFNEAAHTVDQQDLLDARYSRQLKGGGQFDVSLSWDRYHYNGEYPDGGFQDSSTGIWLAAEARATKNLATNQRITVGGRFVDNRRASYKTSDGGSIAPTLGVGNVESVYMEDEYQPRENLTLVGGMRFDRDSQNHGLTPRLGIIFNPSVGSALKLLWGTAFRDPGVYERYFEQIYDPNATGHHLERERIQTMEAVWEQRISSSVLSVVSIYELTVRNLIEQEPEPDSLEISRYFNLQSVTRAHGIEWSLEHRASRGITSYLRSSAQVAREQGIWLTNSPRYLVKAGASLPAHWRAHAASELEYDSGRKTVRGTETDPFLIANVNAVAALSNNFSVRLIVRNAFGAHYATPGGIEHAQAAIMQDGRTFLLQLTWRRSN